MNFKRLFALVTVFCFVLCGAAFAVEEDGGEIPEETPVEESISEETPVGESTPEETPVEESTPEEVPGEESTPDDGEEDEPVYLAGDESDPVQMGYSTYEVGDMAERTDSTVAAAVVSVFGEYQPITHTVTDHLSDGSSVTYEQVVPGLAGVDWVWVTGAAFSAMVLYSVFRLLGVLVK